MENVHVVFSPEIYMLQIRNLREELEKKDGEIFRLNERLENERNLRMFLEARLSEAPSATKKGKAHKQKEMIPTDKAYSDFKSDGKRKAHAADSIRSYDDFHAIQEYYLQRGQVRDWAMWTIGVSLGLRISDLLTLKFCHLIDKDGKTIKPRINIYEQKTGKLNNCLVTESVKYALNEYLKSIKYKFDLDGYLFPTEYKVLHNTLCLFLVSSTLASVVPKGLYPDQPS